MSIFNWGFNNNSNNNNILLEANVGVKDIYGSKEFNKKKEQRYVMIDNAPNHNGRMKVSRHGVRIRRENKKDYISLAFDNGEVKVIAGDPNGIDMSAKELNFYKGVYSRNKNIITFAGNNGRDENLKELNNQFINDEKLYAAKENNKLKYIDHFERDPVNGNLTAYNNKNKILFVNNIDGKNITNNSDLAYSEYNNII